MATLSLPLLSLDLPGNSTRFSVDFGTLPIDFSVLSPPIPGPSNARYLKNTKNKPLPPLHQPVQQRAIPYQNPLPNVTEELETIKRTRSQRSKGQRRKDSTDQFKSPSQPSGSLKKTYSNASTASTSSTYVKSVFSRSQSFSTERSSITSSSRPSTTLKGPKKGLPYLSLLPLSLLEHILSYVLYLPQTVSVGPTSSAQMQYQYYREALDHIDLRQVLKHPIFLVSQHIRDIAHDILYRKCEFTIDLSGIYYTKVSSTVNDNLKKHQKFWNEPPKIVRDSLSNLLRLHIRLPVPSTSTAGRRGRYEDNWMDGSDGKGGGNWRLKSMEKEQEDAQRVQKCLEVIVQLVMTARGDAPEPRGLTRSLSNLSSAKRISTRPKLGRSKSVEYNRTRRGSSDINVEDRKRKPLKRLEVVLVKRSSQALVLSESLGLIRAMRGIPVIGYTRYYFELEGRRLLWATKHKRQWQGIEPDGNRLLQGNFPLLCIYPSMC